MTCRHVPYPTLIPHFFLTPNVPAGVHSRMHPIGMVDSGITIGRLNDETGLIAWDDAAAARPASVCVQADAMLQISSRSFNLQAACHKVGAGRCMTDRVQYSSDRQVAASRHSP